MVRFARVVVESNLLQLDREFDFRIPEDLEAKVSFGQRVSFYLGRSKKLYTGFVTELLTKSQYATSELLGIVSQKPQLTKEQLRFFRKAAYRQVCAIGEILELAIPEHMPRISERLESADKELLLEKSEGLTKEQANLDVRRRAILSSPRKVVLDQKMVPEWIFYLAQLTTECISSGRSALLVLPERDDVDRFLMATVDQPFFDRIIDYAKPKKSDRFSSYQAILNAELSVVVGTRNSIFAPVRNLGLICVYDDLDPSHRSESAPFTNTRELALVRAVDQVDLAFVAPYRSSELQRLVEIGYMESVRSTSAPVKFSFTEPGSRIDGAAFQLIRESLDAGPVLVLVPRKGISLSAFCAKCSTRIRCTQCSGVVWQKAKPFWNCRLCNSPSTLCQSCGSQEFRSGRAGSARTVSELGKAFPGTLITEVTQEKPLVSIRPNRQLVVATAGSVPSYVDQFSAILILDCDIWLGSSSLMSEEYALRDWMESLQLLAINGRALAVGLSPQFGKIIALGQHVEFARNSYLATKELGLPPSVRFAEISGSLPLVETLTSELISAGAEVVRFNSTKEDLASVSIKFSFSLGSKVAALLREHALKSLPVAGKSGNRRGLRIVLDDLSKL